jgi:hypothetical protein
MLELAQHLRHALWPEEVGVVHQIELERVRQLIDVEGEVELRLGLSRLDQVDLDAGQAHLEV